jgi:hypothetical protein
VGQSVREEGSR